VPIAVENLIAGGVPPTVERALYRVIQEALNNAARHGSPTRILVTLLRVRGAVQCRIADNGSGFRPSGRVPGRERGIGLSGMKERIDALGGDVFIRSIPGRGTQILVEIPLGE
jgi:signal transduction histidine kinase